MLNIQQYLSADIHLQLQGWKLENMGNAPSTDNVSRKSLDIAHFDSDESLHSQSGTLTTVTGTPCPVDDGNSNLEIEYGNNPYDMMDDGGINPENQSVSKTTTCNYSSNYNTNYVAGMGEFDSHLNCAPSGLNAASRSDRKSSGRFRQSKLRTIGTNINRSRSNGKNSNNNNNHKNENENQNKDRNNNNNNNNFNVNKRKAIIISFKDVDVNGSHICTVDINEYDVDLLFLSSYDPLSWVITGKRLNNISQVIIRETLSIARLADDKIPQWYVDGIDNKKCQINKDCDYGFYERLTQSAQSAKELIIELENEYNCQIIKIAGGYKAPLQPIDL